MDICGALLVPVSQAALTPTPDSISTMVGLSIPSMSLLCGDVREEDDEDSEENDEEQDDEE